MSINHFKKKKRNWESNASFCLVPAERLITRPSWLICACVVYVAYWCMCGVLVYVWCTGACGVCESILCVVYVWVFECVVFVRVKIVTSVCACVVYVGVKIVTPVFVPVW